MLATVKQLATHLSLSEARIRHYLGLKNAPMPVETGHQVYQGRTPNKYELGEFEEFYHNQIRQGRLRMKSIWEKQKLWNQT